MGIKGFIRSSVVIARRSERVQQKRNRDAAIRYKELLKEQDFTDVAQAIESYNSYVSILKSVHKDCNDSFSWQEIINEPQPVEPQRKNNNEKEAEKKYLSYKPSIFDKLLGNKEKKSQNLFAAIDKAKEKDKDEYTSELSLYEDYSETWIKSQKIAKGVIQNDDKSYRDAFEYFNPLADVQELGTSINLNFETNNLTATLNINGENVIPNFVVSQLKTGKLSKKPMPKGQFYELYQDYVCGCVLRIAREIYAFLPIKMLVIDVKGEILNSVTGHLENMPILSIAIPKETLDKLNFNNIDPSDSFRNFKHNMKFAKTSGFQIVDTISVLDLTNKK